MLARTLVSYSRSVAENSPNQLYYGDNLDVLRLHVPDESVDLVYLDPPFNSNANYNVLFAERDGTQAARRRSRCSRTPGDGIRAQRSRIKRSLNPAATCRG